MTARKIIIDTDPGIDDAMAVLFAALREEFELVGLTSVFGNVSTDIATRNALVLGDLAGRDIPVAAGAACPLVQALRRRGDDVHGVQGFGDVAPMTSHRAPLARPAAAFMAETVRAHPGEVTLCAIGPLTNLALALEADPAIAGKVKGVTVMGGSLDAGGNVTPSAEFNIWQDPHAADRVFSAPWDITLVGIDVTRHVVCVPEHFAALRGPAPKLGGFLDAAAQFYFERGRRACGVASCRLHDPTAVIAMLRPDLFRFEEAGIDVVLDGDAAGRTHRSGDPGRTRLKVATGIDGEAVRDVFLQTIRSGF
jgi:inosine-uridine nucleoside N-ribohydrolase